MRGEDRDTKCLVAGDVKGKFKELYKRVETVNKKAGPFDLLLCVGDFFGEDEKVNKEVFSGLLPPPLPTYILGPTSVDTAETLFQDVVDGAELGPNLTYLGSKGVLNTASGLSIAYLSGLEKPQRDAASFDSDSVKELLIPATANLEYQGVDVLLTSDWPNQVAKWGAPIKDGEAPEGSRRVSQVATILKPRYHFAGLHDLHYERAPYRNHKVLAEGAAQCTRFIGLASVGNARKAKWLYAFNVRPLKFLDRAQLIAQPPDASEFPYNEVLRDLHAEQREADSAGRDQFFYDTAAGPDTSKRGGGRKRDWQGDGDGGGGKRAPAGPCWFCLSSPEVAKHMVVTVGDESYLALAKGQLTRHHLLILPIGHIQSLVAAPEPVRAEIRRFMGALRECYKAKGMGMVFWERNYRTQHLQVQGVPVPNSAIKSLVDTFQQQAMPRGFELEKLEKDQEVWDVLEEEGVPYFYLDLPDGSRLFTRQMRSFPIQFPREVLATKDILNLPDKVDWRQCKQSQEEETDNSIALRKTFAKFDFTAEDSDSD